MSSVPLNIIILPDEQTKKKAQALGRKLDENFKNYYTLKETQFIPHATIYQAQYPLKNVEKVKLEFAKIASEIKPFEVEIGTIFNHHNFIWWNIRLNDYLNKLHYKILERLNPLREDLLLDLLNLDGYKTGEKYTEVEAESVRLYGAVVAGKSFRPHISLGRLKLDHELGDESLFGVLGKEVKLTFKISGLFLGKMGDNGTVTEITNKSLFS